MTSTGCRIDRRHVDTSALLAILLREPEPLDFRAAILRADVARFSTASYVEAHVVVVRRRTDLVDELDVLEVQLSLMIEPLTAEHVRAARDGFLRFGQTRHRARLNFSDSFAYALATVFGEALLFKGADFAQTDVRAAL